jgi:hypothetical protein
MFGRVLGRAVPPSETALAAQGAGVRVLSGRAVNAFVATLQNVSYGSLTVVVERAYTTRRLGSQGVDRGVRSA